MAKVIWITLIIIIILVVGGFLGYNYIFRESSDDLGNDSNFANENSQDELRSNYYNLINNIGDYEGQELTFKSVEIISQKWGNYMPYAIKIVEEDGASITLPLLGKVPRYIQANRKRNVVGIVEKEERGYFLNVSEMKII